MKKIVFSILVLLFLGGCHDKKDVIEAAITGEDGSVIHIVFYDDNANITLPDKKSVLLKGVPAASGTQYANDEYEYTEWHGEIELKKNNETVFKAKNNSYKQ
ncbi:MAG: MliC family protein [Campylobacteraceae bacterium]|jgi:membrane-bound inhibitor of C-type lysozyme|nr:MliC family protein [Campylobacteraceae bacterium]